MTLESRDSGQPQLDIRGGSGQALPLVRNDTYWSPGERNGWQFENYPTQEAWTIISTLIYQGEELPFSAELVNNDLPRMHVLTPYNPELGYLIDERDLSEDERIKKIMENYDYFTQLIGKKEDLVELRIETGRMIGLEDAGDLAGRVTVVVNTHRGAFEGQLSLNVNNPTLNCSRFLPIDTQPSTPIQQIGIDRTLQLFGKDSTSELDLDEDRTMQTLIHAPTSFSLLLPRDPKLLSEVKVEFLLGE